MRKKIVKQILITGLVALLVTNSTIPVLADAGTSVTEEAATDSAVDAETNEETDVDYSTAPDTGVGTTIGTDPGAPSGTDDNTSAGTDDDAAAGTDDDAAAGTDDDAAAGTDDDTAAGTDDDLSAGADDDAAAGADDDPVAGTDEAPASNSGTVAAFAVRSFAFASLASALPETESSVPAVQITQVSQADADLGDSGNAIRIDVAVSCDDTGSYKVKFYAGTKNSVQNVTNGQYSRKFTGLRAGTYDVYAVLYKDSVQVSETELVTITLIDQVLPDGDVTSEASVDEQATGSITVKGNPSKLGYYRYGTSSYKEVSGDTITGLEEGNYYVFLPAYADGNNYYLQSRRVNTTVAGGGELPVQKYTISTSGDAGVSFSKTSYTLKENLSDSIIIRPVNAQTHYIDPESVNVTPAENVRSFRFNESTGELYFESIQGNITISASSVEKPVASQIQITSIDFNPNGIYSEENPSIQTTITLKVTDRFSNPVPSAKVYFKSDDSEVSYKSGITDISGVVSFKNSYSINRESDGITADYTPVAALDNTGRGAVNSQIHLVLQLKNELVLYTDQIIGTEPGENNGKVINVPDGYEIWTGEVHQGAIVTGTGEWIPAVNGEFTGLSAGQHIIRAGEKIGADNTFTFASDYADFFIPRGLYDVKVDTAASENVRFTGNIIQSASAEQPVYIYLEPDNGYEIAEYSVDKPSRIGGITYDKENGYIVLKSVSGSVVLTVKAVKTKSEKQGGSTVNNITTDIISPIGNTRVFSPVGNIPVFSPIGYTPVLTAVPEYSGTTEVSDEAGSAETPLLTETSAPAVNAGNTVILQPVSNLVSRSVLGENRTANIQNDAITSNEIRSSVPEKNDAADEKPDKAGETAQIIDPEVPLSQSIPETVEADGISFIWIILLGVAVIMVVAGSYAVYTKIQGKKEGE